MFKLLKRIVYLRCVWLVFYFGEEGNNLSKYFQFYFRNGGGVGVLLKKVKKMLKIACQMRKYIEQYQSCRKAKMCKVADTPG